MKKRVLIFIALFTIMVSSFAQTKKNAKDLIVRASDHFMIQLSSDHWLGAADSVKSHTKGLSRGLGVYVMFDKRFRNSPQFSVAFGLGLGNSNIYFSKMTASLDNKTNNLPFNQLDNLAHFKRYKIATTYLEVPLELRYTVNPENEMKSIKAAIGVKVGTILNAHTKGKIWQDATGGTINSSTEKTTNKNYFNSTRIAATARIGYGNFSLFGSYGLTNVFKDGVAADTKLLQIGLQISGL